MPHSIIESDWSCPLSVMHMSCQEIQGSSAALANHVGIKWAAVHRDTTRKHQSPFDVVPGLSNLYGRRSQTRNDSV